MELGIKGLRVLVTAGASGIGREVARGFVMEGAKVFVCDVDAKALAALKRSDPKSVRARPTSPTAGRSSAFSNRL